MQVYCGTCSIQSDQAHDEVEISKELLNQSKVEHILWELVYNVNIYVNPALKCELESPCRPIERILFDGGMQLWVHSVKRLCGSHLFNQFFVCQTKLVLCVQINSKTL